MVPGASNGWTGGQYSAVRALLGVILLASAVGAGSAGLPGPGTPLPPAARLLEIPFATFLLLGWHDRLAALVLMISPLADLVTGWHSGLAPALLFGHVAPLAALGIHLALPPAPFGSVAARRRPDPDGGWRMPGWVPWAARAVVGSTLIYGALAAASGAASFPWSSLARAIPLLALAADPGWVRPLAGETDILFYDGTCGLCHRAVRFVLAEDRRARIRFAPLSSAVFFATIPAAVRPSLPDSLVVWSPGGEIRVRSEALLHLAGRLGGWWRALAALARLVPRPLRDALYDAVARNRRRLASAPEHACPVVAPELNARFLESPAGVAGPLPTPPRSLLVS